MLTFIVFLIAKSTLPVFDISCVNDNMFFVFEKGQDLFNTKSIIFAEYYILIESLAALLLSCYLWLERGKTFKFPISLFIFFMFKYFVDLSVKLKVPTGTIYEDLPFMGLSIPVKSLFFSNCDPYLVFNLFLITYIIREEFEKQ